MPQIAQDLTLDQIETLLAIVDHGSFTAAARALNRTQGGVSYHLQRLEEQLELRLFDRGGRLPVLTEAGGLIVREARTVRGDLQRLREVAAGLNQGLEARVNLTVDILYPPGPLAEMLNRFQAEFPTVDVHIETGIATEPMEMVRRGHATIAVGQAIDSSDLAVVRALTIEFVLVVAPFHPLATLERPLTPDNLRQYPNLVLPTAPEAELSVRGTAPGLRRWRVGDSFMRHELVRMGAGWSRLPRHQVRADLASGRLVVPDVSALPGATAQLQLAVLHHPERPPGPAGRWWVENLAVSQSGVETPVP